MSTSLVYKNPFLYEAVMRVLYGAHFASRYQSIADLIPSGSSVVDVCCGPPVLFRRFLRHKEVKYTGVDLNERFIAELLRSGAQGIITDLQSVPELPRAEYVIMQASLYHFLPEPSKIVHRMLAAARKYVIVSEPVRNLSSSTNPLVARFARAQTNPGSGEHRQRFDEAALDAFFAAYAPLVERSFLAPGGREKIYVIRGSAKDAP